jgi:hypothetical protein
MRFAACFAAMGAIDADGTMLHEQIQLASKNIFDTPKLFILSEEAAGEVHIILL